MALQQLIMAGGITLIILALCSIVSLAVILERWLYYMRRSRVKRKNFMANIKDELKKGNIEEALKKCKKANTPFSDVAHAGLSFYGHSEKEISNNMERTIVIETNLLEKHTSIVGTIGSTAVYIGLFGTVLGIIKAFNDISSSGTGGINVVTTGISESLVCTAAGLCVAVPAVMAYNYFIKKIDNFITDMELCASEAMDLITAKQK
jgi:biopolymer transport protein ExbB